jgi:uncharacterized protein with HEPN domain
MSKRDDRVSLVDMLIYAEEAIEILGETGLIAMVRDRVMQLALQKLVETVGEAARRVSQQTQEQHPAIAWRQIYEMRNRLAHPFDRADLKVLWNVIVNDLPRLVEQLEEIVGRDPGHPDRAVDP